MSDDDDSIAALVELEEHVASEWQDVITEMDRISTEVYDQWEVLSVHPVHISMFVSEGGEPGFDVLLADNEFDDVVATVGDADSPFEDCDVFRRTADPVVFSVLGFKRSAQRHVLLVPLYYSLERANRKLAEASGHHAVNIHLRNLEATQAVGIALTDPQKLFPQSKDGPH